MAAGVRDLITTTSTRQLLLRLLDRPRPSTLLVSCWRPGLVPCADWGVFDEVRVRYAGVHTPETVARSLSSTHNPRDACCYHSPMYIPLLAADVEEIFHGLCDSIEYITLLLLQDCEQQTSLISPRSQSTPTSPLSRKQSIWELPRLKVQGTNEYPVARPARRTGLFVLAIKKALPSATLA